MFLEKEIPVLAEHFELCVLPRVGSQEEHRLQDQLSSLFHVRSISAEAKHCKRRKLFQAILSVLSRDFIFEWIRHLPQTMKPQASLRILKAIYADELWYEVFMRLLSTSEIDMPDLVYCFWSLPQAPGISRACNELDIPFVQRAHGFDLYGDRYSYGFIPFQPRNIDRATVTFAVSDQGRDYLREIAPSSIRRIQTARLGVRNQEPISSTAQGRFRLVSCSRVIELKRVDLIARAVLELSQKLPNLDFEWVHFGSGPQLDEIKAMVASRLSDPFRVVFRGQVDNEDILNFYRNEPVSLFVNVSTSEGIPVSIMEAMSFGIPVLATDVGGTPEIVNETNGTLIPAEITSKDLAEAIREVILWDFSKNQQIREMALRTQRDLYSANRNYSAFASELLALVE